LSTENENKNNSAGKGKVFDACPHCGRVLSPWEKVLLSVDRMLVCKSCWYRIILDVYTEEKTDDKKKKEYGDK
jgi:DNA-directed RNA polymerase subunit RPC12/RpoP